MGWYYCGWRNQTDGNNPAGTYEPTPGYYHDVHVTGDPVLTAVDDIPYLAWANDTTTNPPILTVVVAYQPDAAGDPPTRTCQPRGDAASRTPAPSIRPTRTVPAAFVTPPCCEARCEAC